MSLSALPFHTVCVRAVAMPSRRRTTAKPLAHRTNCASSRSVPKACDHRCLSIRRCKKADKLREAGGLAAGRGSQLGWSLTSLIQTDRIFVTRRRSLGVARAQRSRFFTKYTRSAQDKIEHLVKLLCSSNESAAETLAEHASWVQPPDWFNVLDGIGRRRRWLLALEVFRWMQVQKWYKADNGYYSKLISIMGKERQYRLAMSVFKEMKKMGCRPDTSLYNSVLTVYLRSEDKANGFEKALALLEEMKLKRKCQPNIVTYNILTRAAAQLGREEDLRLLFGDLFDRDLTPDLYTFNGLMDVYGKAGDIAKMEDSFQRMRDEKLTPDIITFNTLIDAYGKAGAFEKMEQVYRSMMLKRKIPIKPTSKTFNSMIFNYGVAGLVEKAELLVREMQEVGVSPTFVTHECLLGAYGRCGQFEEMRHCLRRMQSANFSPQISTLNKMLELYCSHGKTSEAESLLINSVTECRVVATSASYAIVIRAHGSAGNHSNVRMLLDNMKKSGVRPGRGTYLDVLESIGVVRKPRDLDRNSRGVVEDLDELSGVVGLGGPKKAEVSSR